MNNNLFLVKNHGNFQKKIEAGGIFRSIITSIKGIYDILDDTIAPKV